MLPTMGSDVVGNENSNPIAQNSGNDHVTALQSHSRVVSTFQASFPVTPTPPSTAVAVAPPPSSSSLPRHINIFGRDRYSRARNHPYPPSPSRFRLDSEYSSRLQQHNPQASVLSPPGIRRGRQRNIFFSGAGGSTQSSDESKTNNIQTAFFTPERSSSSSGNPTRRNTSPFLDVSPSPWITPSGSNRSGLASVSIDTSDTGYSDRFIPSRATSNLNFSFSDRDNTARSPSHNGNGNQNSNDPDMNMTQPPGANEAEEGANTSNTPSRGNERTNPQSLLNALLRSELLGSSPDYQNSVLMGSTTPQRENNFLQFQSPRQLYSQDVLRDSSASVVNAFNLSPVGNASSHRLLAAPQKRKRKIGKVPFKVLDAPSLQDDFYLNLVDWSTQNVLAVGLGSCVYLWSACTSKVTKLCDLSSSEDAVTSVSWTQRGTHLAVGTNHGEIQLWDSTKCIMIRKMGGHSARIGTLSWNGPTLASGSRDRLICLRDVRVPQNVTTRFSAHKQEVCGLKWSHDEPAQLASGGNDNKLLVWDIKNHSQPIHRFAEHTAAVKAIAWSPHQHGLLASGGGTADRCVRFWNTLSGTKLSCIDTGSQVCNLAWSRNCNEIVSTHGYSLNQIVVWRYPSMTKVATLTGHTYRVLYLAVSPDGSTIVTGAGDETLRFWQVFPGPRSHNKGASSGLLFPTSPGSIIR